MQASGGGDAKSLAVTWGNAIAPAYDVMTAEVPELDWVLLRRITARVTAEVLGVCRVCYDLTPKSVGTVEWE